jgi:hypothetical protein
LFSSLSIAFEKAAERDIKHYEKENLTKSSTTTIDNNNNNSSNVDQNSSATENAIVPKQIAQDKRKSVELEQQRVTAELNLASVVRFF